MRFRPKVDPRLLLSADFLITAAIFLFAFALRVYGVHGSLPYVGHPDEPKLIDSATHIVKSGNLNPHLYIWPSLYIYLEALVIRAHLVWGTLRGYYAGPQSLPDVSHIFSLATGVYVWARTLTAAIGAATAALLYVVGREMFNGSRRVGVVAALMFAISPLHVEYSHFALTDVPLGLVGLTVLWASYRLSRVRDDGRDLFWWSALCGLLVGIAAGTKYNGLYIIIVPLIAWVMRWRRSGGSIRTLITPGSARSLGAIALSAVLGFVLCEPYVLLDLPSFYNGFTFQVGAYEPAKNLEEVAASIRRHLTDLSANDGYFLGPAALGAAVLLFNPPVRNRAWLLIVFPIFYLLAMSRFSLTYVRNLIITLPFLAIMGGYAMDLAATQVVSMLRTTLPSLPQESNRRFWGTTRWLAVAGLMSLFAVQPLTVSINYSRYQADPESRNLAWNWMQERMRVGDRFAAELHPWQTEDWPDVLAFDVENPDTAVPLTTEPPEWYARRGYNMVVLNSNYRDAQRDPAAWAQYLKLPIVKEFAGDKEGGKGPTITVRATFPGSPNPPTQRLDGTELEDFAALAGYDLAPITNTGVLLDPGETLHTGTFKPGEAVGLNLYYRALRDGKPTDPNWQVWIHLIDPASGSTVAQLDVRPLVGQLRDYPGVSQQSHPVSRWHGGEWLAGVYNIGLPAGLRPGTYRLDTGMWVPPNGPGAQIRVGGQATDHVTLGNIVVK